MLTDAYKACIENERLKQLLLRRENIPVLEEILANETEELKRLGMLEKQRRVKLGRNITNEKREDIFADIHTLVNAFLAVQAEPPRYRWLKRAGDDILYPRYTWPEHIGSHYESISQTVFLERLPPASVIPIAAHEYTHHIQNVAAGLCYKPYAIFEEGHAIGVQRHIEQIYREQEKDEAFRYAHLGKQVEMLTSAYRWLCGESIKGGFRRPSLPKTQPSPHALGNALFRIYEAKHGKDIYQKAIHGEVKFE